jgi:hypothetical protein
MSQENVEMARRIYPTGIDLAAAFANPEALTALRTEYEPLVDPEFETVADPRYQMLLGGSDEVAGPSGPATFHGLDGFIGTFAEWLSGWESWMVSPVEFIDVDESRVLVVADISGRSKAQQAEMTTRGGNLLTFGNGRLTRIELFFRKADALEAAGLSE